MTNELIVMQSLNIEAIQRRVCVIRGVQVLLDRDLAELYGVETRVLNQAVRRNIDRFPSDFMFVMTEKEVEDWKSQIVISNSIKMGLRKMPIAFTELGIAMLSSVLRSETAIQVNINIMRAFVAMRHAVAAMQSADMKVEQLAHKVDQMDAHIDELMHEQRDINREQTETNNEVALQIEAINNALDQLREKPAPKRNKIGYKKTEE